MTEVIKIPTTTKYLNELTPHPDNYNTHPKQQISQLAESLTTFGQFKNIVTWTCPENMTTPDGIELHEGLTYILAGHGLWLAAMEAGIDELEVKDYSGLSYEMALGLLMVDNAAPLGSEPDSQRLAALLERTREMTAERPGLKAMLEALKVRAGVNGNGGESKDIEPQIDKAAELAVKWGTRVGQVWELGAHRLAVGDCTDRAVVEAVMRGERADLCVTDPPYAVNYDPQWRVGLGGGGTQEFANGKVIQNDDNMEWVKTFGFLPADVLYCWTAALSAVQLIECLQSFGFGLLYLIIWNKDLAVFGRGDYHHKHEPCLYMARKGKNHNWQGDRKQETVWDIPTIHSFANGHNSEEWGLVGHGNQKPVECMARPIRNNSAEGEIIYDPFVGSGTTLIACENLGRKCRAIELDPGYAAVSIQRWVDLTGGEPRLLTG